MTIQRILNNNVVIALDEKRKECVIVGKGVAFGKKSGERLTVTRDLKVFKLSRRGAAEKLSNIIEDIPIEHIKVCDEIINMARQELGKLDEKIYLTLIEHISFAINRFNEGLGFADSFWEIKRLYPKEYRIGLIALDVIDKRLNVSLPDNEACFIALHILNANGITTSNAADSMRLVQGMLDIVHQHFQIEFDEESTAYSRFMLHLRFLSGRVIGKEYSLSKPTKENKILLQFLEETSEERKCAEEIASFIKREFHHKLSREEKCYLIIHIHSILAV